MAPNARTGGNRPTIIKYRAPVVESAFDVAQWLLDRALNDNEYLQPQKLHRLLFLAQAYYAVANHGFKLMPATFVANEAGPIEPNLYRAYEAGRPVLEPRTLPDAVAHFLDSIWRRFGAHSADHLSRVIRKHPPYAQAWNAQPGSEITFKAMVTFYGDPRNGRSQTDTRSGPAPTADERPPSLEEVLRPRVMRSASGKPVNVTRWSPRNGAPRRPADKA